MSWRTTLRPEARITWERARELSDPEIEAWILDEVEGRGFASGRDPVEPVDVFREAWAAGGARFQERFAAALIAAFVARFDAAGEPAGLPDAGRRALHLLTDSIVGLRLVGRVKERFERGIYVEWAARETEGLIAPHSLRQAFAAGVLEQVRPRGAPLRRLLGDAGLVNLAFGSLAEDLSVSMEYLPATVDTLLGTKGARALRTHLLVLKEKFGALAVEDALERVFLDAGPRRFLADAVQAAGMSSSLPIRLDLERGQRLLGQSGGSAATDRIPRSVRAGSQK